MANEPPPPPPPPHGQNPHPPGGLPDGNYDIFIIPPHSAGGGFLYLPSLQPQRNSFLAGIAVTLFAVGVWTLVVPVLKQWLGTVVQSGGVAVVLLVLGVGVAGWAWGKTQGENQRGPGPGGGGGDGASSSANAGQQQQHHSSSGAKANGCPPPPRPETRSNGFPPPPYTPPPPQPEPKTNGQTGWEKAREETRKREEERKAAEALRKKREEAERAIRAKAEKLKWEQARAREKEARERDAREKDAREKEGRERGQDGRAEALKAARERLDAAKARTASAGGSSPKKPTNTSSYQKPSARSYVDGVDEDAPSHPRPTYKSSASSISGLSESSYAPSQSTARTTPPPSQRGKYSTKDPDKILIKAVYLFSDSSPTRPLAQLVAGEGAVTDGLILRITSEGLFIDDDVRGVAQREWDVKAWTLKLVEDGTFKPAGIAHTAGQGAAALGSGQGLHILRATARDVESKKYCFVLDETEAWKVALGLARLRKGSQVRSLGMQGLRQGEVGGILGGVGWV